MTHPGRKAENEAGDRCKFSTYGYACGKAVEHGRYLCEEHAVAKCASCGQAATHGCDYCGQFVCGTPLCDECTFGTDNSKPAGAWGFINHIHISKPEFAEKHENARLKAQAAADQSRILQLEAERDELRRAVEWRPIETAPRGANGIAWMMLAYGPAEDESVGIGMRFHDQFFAAGTFYVGGPAGGRQFNFRDHEVKPTHWMPLPPAPLSLNPERAEGGE